MANIATSKLQNFKTSKLQNFKTSKLQNFKTSKLQRTLLFFIILIVQSCSIAESDQVKLTVFNTSNDDLIISFVAASKIERVTTIDDLNREMTASSKILSKESKVLHISRDVYCIFYNYSDIWGALTVDGLPKVFNNLTDSTITINKQGWEYDGN